ncbi:hypothetical protein FACS1894110_26790 [Spirochaetia bacterium]|nr:hypothetical protein FACS1894110_26790 [Spirochaetia bacterium]
MSDVDQPVKAKSGKKEFVGIVKSDKMAKTIVVAVETTALHPLYKKYVRRIKKLKARDDLDGIIFLQLIFMLRRN